MIACTLSNEEGDLYERVLKSPDKSVWGVSTESAQIEGAAAEDYQQRLRK